MADKIELRKFPANKIEALTMLYLENQDLKSKTAEEIARLYDETYLKIHNEFTEIDKDRNNYTFL